MNIPDKIDSLAVFGSYARGDADESSDKDVLVVSTSHDELRSYCALLSEQGWSCAPYTWEKLEDLNSCKALFLQHLKCEGKIIKDSNGKLKKLLDSFKPKDAYSDEIALTKKLAEIPNQYPSDANGVLWALDILFVALRNIGILTLAEHHEYQFSFSAILRALSTLGYLEEKDYSRLITLRHAKHAYRKNSRDFKHKHSTLTYASSIINHRFGGKTSPKPVPKHEFLKYALDNELWNRTNNWYLRLRLLEGAAKAMVTDLDVESLKTHDIFNEVLCQARNTRSYVFESGSKDGSQLDLNLTRSKLIAHAKNLYKHH